MRRDGGGSSPSSCSSRARTSCRSCSRVRLDPRRIPPRVLGVYRRADLRASRARRLSGAVARRRPRQRRRRCFGRPTRSAPRWRSPMVAPTRRDRRRSARRAGAIFRVPLLGLGRSRRARRSRSSRTAARRSPSRPDSAGDVPARIGARGAPGEPRNKLLQGHDPAAGRGGVAERRCRRRDRALRALAFGLALSARGRARVRFAPSGGESPSS